jgi:hypothetical protein
MSAEIGLVICICEVYLLNLLSRKIDESLLQLCLGRLKRGQHDIAHVTSGFVEVKAHLFLLKS